MTFRKDRSLFYFLIGSRNGANVLKYATGVTMVIFGTYLKNSKKRILPAGKSTLNCQRKRKLTNFSVTYKLCYLSLRSNT